MRFVLFIIVALFAFTLSIQIRRRGLSPQLAALGIGPGILQLIGLAAAALALFQTITIIDAGRVGVVKIFGQVQNVPLTEGINIRNPFAEIIKMNVQTQRRHESMEVLEKEGLKLGLEITVIYHLDGAYAPDVVRTISGGDYVNNILVPNFRSIVRGMAARHKAEALYAEEGRAELGQGIAEQLAAATVDRGIVIEATLLRDVALPAKVMVAIEDKQQAKQESERMQYIIEKETKEADRKRIEAQGIRDFNKTVAEGISDNFLRWKGIEATEKLAASPNAKVVVIGSGKDGLPIILGGQ